VWYLPKARLGCSQIPNCDAQLEHWTISARHDMSCKTRFTSILYALGRDVMFEKPWVSTSSRRMI